MSPERQPTRRRGTTAEEMRLLIDQAEADGVKRAKMTLRMTLRDASELKRDPKVAMEDIRYAAEGMRYLGVLVEQGGVTISTLDRGDTSFVRGAMAAAAAAPKVKPKPKPRAKSAKKVAAEKAAAEAAAAAEVETADAE
jgi:hypothetical protein